MFTVCNYNTNTNTRQDFERELVIYRVACAGGLAKRELHPRTTTHVLVDTLTNPSKKVLMAKEK